MRNARQRGTSWETAAECWLCDRGLRTVERNFLCRVGEIDLIMEDRETLVFAEIRYRRNSRFGSGAETVTLAKQQRIVRAAQRYLQFHPHRANQPCRFDVLSLDHASGIVRVDWIRGAFSAG